jgi:hypothetical protein
MGKSRKEPGGQTQIPLNMDLNCLFPEEIGNKAGPSRRVTDNAPNQSSTS